MQEMAEVEEVEAEAEDEILNLVDYSDDETDGDMMCADHVRNELDDIFGGALEEINGNLLAKPLKYLAQSLVEEEDEDMNDSDDYENTDAELSALSASAAAKELAMSGPPQRKKRRLQGYRLVKNKFAKVFDLAAIQEAA